MRKIRLYLALSMLGLLTVGCKSSQHLQKNEISVTNSDFQHVNDKHWEKWKAIRLDETAYVYVEDQLRVPWVRVNYPYMMSYAWSTNVVEKILFLKNDVSKDPFFSVDYFNPTGMSRDLMTKCKMSLYSLNPDGTIQVREMEKKELIRERLNDSISRIRWDGMSGRMWQEKS